MILGSSVTSIKTNKHGTTRNHNSGIVQLRCFVNEYCPFDKTNYTEHILLYNDETFQAFPRTVRDRLNYVPTQDGVFLKSFYYYSSNYLWFVDPKTYKPDASNLESGDIRPGAKIHYDAAKAESLKHNNQKYRERHFSWIVIEHPFQTKTIISPSSYVKDKANSTKDDPQKWGYFGVNEDVGVNAIYERPDATVYYMYQSAASVNPFAYVSGTTKDPGVHWRVEQAKPIFGGEDFFLQFKRATFSNDIVNRSGYADFLNNNMGGDPIYRCLDVSFRSPNEVPNAALIEYDNPQGTTLKTDQTFDFTRQPYIIIEMKREASSVDPNSKDTVEPGENPEYAYFIILAYRANPRFIKVINNQSYFVSEYAKWPSSELFKKDFKISVRNHLGKIIVNFNDDYNNPWVIENDLVKSEDGNDYSDPILFLPLSRLSLCFSSLALRFSFRPS